MMRDDAGPGEADMQEQAAHYAADPDWGPRHEQCSFEGCNKFAGHGGFHETNAVYDLAQRPFVPTISYRALDRRVLAVARTRIEGAWAAYVGAVPGVSHETEKHFVLQSGAKLHEPLARLLFPEYAALRYAP